jgi:tetratricopeptide (TPR) repeat protein
MALRGDRETAIAQMRELLNVDPDYHWGWQQIANWYDASEAHGDYLEAAENLVRLSPRDPVAYAYRGEAKLFGGDRRGAKTDFQKSYDLDPNYLFAGLHLIDEQLTDDELEAAGKTLARLQEHIGGPYVRLRAVRLAVKSKDAETARAQFCEMCRDDEATYMLLSKGVDALTEVGWGSAADDVLDEMIEDDNSVVHVGRVWVERCAARSESSFEQKLSRLLERGEIGQEALFAAVDALAKPMTAGRLHDCLARHEQVLRETNRGWAKSAQALVEVRDYAAAAVWMADWKQRDIREPWMLLPAALTFRIVDRVAEAYDASRKALQLSPDASTPVHQLYVALEDALEGRTSETVALLIQLDPEDLDDVPRLFFVFAETLAAVQRAAAGDRAASFKEAKKKVDEALASYAPMEANEDLKRTYKRWLARMAKDRGGLSGLVWGAWKKFRPSI